MELQVEKTEALLLSACRYFNSVSDVVIKFKPSENKWSKKEILGHLIDSAIHNLVRFTEINYVEKPYHHRPYSQIDLVNLNQYQTMDTDELVQLWLSLNKQIIRVFKNIDDKALDYQIILSDQSVIDLKFLMTDYVQHSEYHINQILN
jgi:hypothetical protein